ncbi:MAG: sugar transferase [Lachnospiraceae bacterium]|nr:sugar transferase [Lachnospiraceae bacterium]
MHERKLEGWLKHWDFTLLDLIFLQVCFVLSYWLTKGFGNPYRIVLYRYQAIVLVFCQALVVLFTDSYKNILKRSLYQEIFATFRYMTYVMLIDLVYLFLVHQISLISRLHTGTMVLMFFFVSLGVRQLNKLRLLKTRSNVRTGRRSMLIITSSRLAQEVVDHFKENAAGDMKLTGVVLMDQASPDVRRIGGIPTMGRGDNILHQIGKMWVDEVFIYQPENMPYPEEFVESLLLMGITVHYCLSALNHSGSGMQEMEKVGGYKVLTNSLRIVSVRQMLLKRLMDICGGIVGCIMTGIFFIFVAPAIYIKSPGPIFFKQERVGQNGKTFQMYKFRSMYMDAEKRKKELEEQNKIEGGMMFKMDDDPRIIGSEKKDKNGRPCGIGNFIRNTSIDEFPQFWNVLKGEMSLVGTRPPTLDDWNKYDLHHRVRMSIKPGITGLWQISGRSNIVDFEEVVRLDREYIQNWSLELDLRILLKTVSVVLRHDGAS